MGVDQDNVLSVVEVEDRLSRLPDELIYKILSSLDMKVVVQTCVLSSRWKLVWTSMSCLNFSSNCFNTSQKFRKCVSHVLSHHNHQVQVSCVQLTYNGRADQAFVRKIAKYAYSHNVQQLTVRCNPEYHHHNKLPSCLFSSQFLKHFTLSTSHHGPLITPKTPWDFPALTTLHLDHIILCDQFSEKRVDLFSKCVNLKEITLECFSLGNVEVFDIITPRLSNLIFIGGSSVKTINVIAPELENLTIIHCEIEHLNAPPQLSSFCYKLKPWIDGLLEFTNERFHSLNKVNICFSWYCLEYNKIYEEEDAHKTINMLQDLYSARYLTLNPDIIEFLSTFPELVSNHPSPFSNLISLSIESNEWRDDAYSWKISEETRNFFLGNSPYASLIMKVPKIVTKIMELQELIIEQWGNMEVEEKQEIENQIMEFRALMRSGGEYGG